MAVAEQNVRESLVIVIWGDMAERAGWAIGLFRHDTWHVYSSFGGSGRGIQWVTL